MLSSSDMKIRADGGVMVIRERGVNQYCFEFCIFCCFVVLCRYNIVRYYDVV